MARIHIDNASERLALELCRADLEAELRLPQGRCQHDLLSSQLSALDM